MKRLMLSLAVLVITATVSLGDQLTMGKIVKDGALQGFEKNKFRFFTSKGKFVNEQASRVTDIKLEKPKKCTYLTSTAKKEERGILKSFTKDKFTITPEGKNAKDVIIPVSKMKKLEISLDSGTSGSAGGGSGNAYPIPNVDLKAFTGEFTPEQQKVMDAFVAAKKAFDDFATASSAVVDEMNTSTGAHREELINQLRKRKIDEQPLRKDLVAAYNALAEAFPEKPDDGTKPVAQTPPPTGEETRIEGEIVQPQEPPVEKPLEF